MKNTGSWSQEGLEQRARVGQVLGKRIHMSSEASQVGVGTVVLKGMMPCSLEARILIVMAELLFPLKGGCPNTHK